MDNQEQPQQLTKRERRELRRQEDQKQQAGQKKKMFIKKIFTWTVWIGVIGGLGYGLIYVGSRPEKSRSGEVFPSLGAQHIPNGAERPAYNSNPPTSGGHYGQPAAWGVYYQELPDEQIVHNLEHGGIWISYKDIDEEIKKKLEIIGKNNPGSVVVSPRSANDAKIAIAAWTRLEKMDVYDEEKIINFIKANKNKSPEPIAK